MSEPRERSAGRRLGHGDGPRLHALRGIHARLAPGAPFLLIDGCTEPGTERFEEEVRRYARFALRPGAPRVTVEKAVRMQRESVPLVSPAREEALLAEAGFTQARSFYQGLWVFGWIATA